MALGATRLEELPEGTVTMLPHDRCSLSAIDAALEQLETVSPKHKQMLIEACATCCAADGIITVEDAELLRAVSDSLRCPMPPLLPGQELWRPTWQGAVEELLALVKGVRPAARAAWQGAARLALAGVPGRKTES